MIEKNDPHQEKVKSDLSDDDLIIELTDEILVSSEDDHFIESDDLIQDDESPIVEDEITNNLDASSGPRQVVSRRRSSNRQAQLRGHA